MKNLVLKAGHFYRKDFDPETPTVRDIDLTLWLFHQLKEFGLNPNFVCCPHTPNPTVVDTDTRLTNPHVNGSDLCFDLLNVVTTTTVSDAVCIPIAQLNINTTMVDNGDGTYTYTNEAGVTTTFNTGVTPVPVNVLTSNTTNSTSIDVTTLPNQPACVGTKTYVLLNADGTGATINSSTGVVSINTANFYPFCGKKKLSGHILCGTDIVGHFILDIQYEEYDVYEYEVSCLFRDPQMIESTINGVPFLSKAPCLLPVSNLAIANIGNINLYPAVSGNDALAAQLNSQQFFNGIPCASYKALGTDYLQLSIPKGTSPAPGALTSQLFKRYKITHYYEVTKLGAPIGTRRAYADENLPLIESPAGMNNMFGSTFGANEKAAGALNNNIHFLDGIYGLKGTAMINLFRTRGLKDMYRYTFAEFREDDTTPGTGLNGYSNRGINEIGGIDPLNALAYENFKRHLIQHIETSANAQGYCVVARIEDNGTLINNTNQLDLSYNLYLDVPTDITITMMSGHNLTSVAGATGPYNEWGYADNNYTNKKIEDWNELDIFLQTPTHQPPATLIPTAGLAQITPGINGSIGANNFETGCKHGTTNTGV